MGRHRLGMLWLLTLVILAGQLGGKAWNRRRYLAVKQVHEAAYVKRRDADRAVIAPLVAQLQQMSAARLPPAAVLERLKAYGPKPVGGYGPPNADRYEFWEPQTGIRFEIDFIDNAVWGQAYWTVYPSLDTTPWDRLGHAMKWVGGVGMFACVVAFTAAVASGPRRRAVGNVMLAIALVTATAWAQDPRPGGFVLIEVRSLWFWTAAAMVVIGLAMIGTKRGRAIDPSACPQCGYDLTGNVSGVCPECGSPRMTAAARA